MKKLLFVLLGLLALTSCHDKEEAQPATEEQLKELTGHWYAELPLSGETENWRTEEEGDMTTYDKIGALIYLNGAVTDACYWGYLYLQNGDMVNYDGLHHRDQEANFAFTMDSEGNITTSSNLPDAPQVSNMHYDSTRKVITADVTFKGRSLSVTFTFVSDTNQQETLNEFYQILAEEGIVGGASSIGGSQNTDLSDDNAKEPSRAKSINY